MAVVAQGKILACLLQISQPKMRGKYELTSCGKLSGILSEEIIAV